MTFAGVSAVSRSALSRPGTYPSTVDFAGQLATQPDRTPVHVSNRRPPQHPNHLAGSTVCSWLSCNRTALSPVSAMIRRGSAALPSRKGTKPHI